MNRITIIGAGYVGLSNAVFLADYYYINLIDIDRNKLKMIREGISPLSENLLKDALPLVVERIKIACKIDEQAIISRYVLICTPTNFNPETSNFDTSSIDQILSELEGKNFTGFVIIRSTVPIGYTDSVQKKFPKLDIAFFPEFSREGMGLHDLYYPSRIICGSSLAQPNPFTQILSEAAKSENVVALVTTTSEAEAIKLFSNTYLAMRVAFFNELDSFAYTNGMNVRDVISGVSLDSRIGNYYNNPSFGYGGYCLPKDTSQLLSNFGALPKNLIQATIESNETRKKFIVEIVKSRQPNTVGIYRLTMKKNSDNWRESPVLTIIRRLQ
ncbi:MAG: UDP-glucose 6-dehydrogenase, partial [Gammaproteobacteria bacterium]|nr:UDP-glucose 6-dehydrogenase [Gammaproteobacteria bacterium]